MEYLIIPGILFVLVVSLILVLVLPIDDKEDIKKTPNGRFYPTVGGSTLFITNGGTAEKWGNSLNNYNMFNTHKEAVEFLNRWKELRGEGSVSVGLEYKE